jgi:hypothetical protein
MQDRLPAGAAEYALSLRPEMEVLHHFGQSALGEPTHLKGVGVAKLAVLPRKLPGYLDGEGGGFHSETKVS